MIATLLLTLTGCSATPARTTASATDVDLQKFRNLEGLWDADFDGNGESDMTISLGRSPSVQRKPQPIWAVGVHNRYLY